MGPFFTNPREHDAQEMMWFIYLYTFIVVVVTLGTSVRIQFNSAVITTSNSIPEFDQQYYTFTRLMIATACLFGF